MVDHSAKVIAVWNGDKSGTKNTVDYAKKCNVELVNIYKNEKAKRNKITSRKSNV